MERLPRARVLAGVVLAVWCALSCQHDPVTEMRGRRIRSADLRPFQLGRTTPVEIEARFGTPTVREADGALTYRHESVRRRGRAIGAWTLSTNEEVETRVVTFRFAHGVLVRICRSRS